MKKAKSTLCFAIALAMAIGLLSACGSSETPTAETSQSNTQETVTPNESTTPSDSIEKENTLNTNDESFDSTDTAVGEEGDAPAVTPDDSENTDIDKPADDDKQDSTSNEDKTPEKDDGKQEVTPKPEDKPVDGDKDVETDPVHQHTYKDSVVKPTCTEKGYTLHSCSCGESYKDNEVAALGHKYTSQVIAPTTSEEGYTLYTCQTCGHSYKDNFVDKLAGSIDVPSSDLDGKKVGFTYVNAEDSNNLVLDNLGNMVYDIGHAAEGTVIRHSDLELIGSANENVTNFFTVMNQIDATVQVDNNGQISYIGSGCGEYRVKDGNYVLTKDGWGGWSNGTKVGRNIFLNALVYFGGEDMGTAVYGMLDEHYRFRSDGSVPISNELAAKYGLTIKHLTNDDLVHTATVSNGMDSWYISYCTENPYGMQDTIIKIPT